MLPAAGEQLAGCNGTDVPERGYSEEGGERLSTRRSSGDGPACWICLEQSLPDQPLQTPCKCSSRPVHMKCLARWQLQAAGRLEENVCRFCMCTLPDWRSSLTPPQVKPVRPVMAIKFDGKTYKLRVQPGPEGLQLFKEQVRQLLGFDINEEFDVSFECQVPSTGEKLSLTGLSSYGAATHCAAVVAAERKALNAANPAPAPSTPEHAPPPAAPQRAAAPHTRRHSTMDMTTLSATGAYSPSASNSASPPPPNHALDTTSISPVGSRSSNNRLASTLATVPTLEQSTTGNPTSPPHGPRSIGSVSNRPHTVAGAPCTRAVTTDAPSVPAPRAHTRSLDAHGSRTRRSSDYGTPSSSLSRALMVAESAGRMLPPIRPSSPVDPGSAMSSATTMVCVNLGTTPTCSTASSLTGASPVASSTFKLPIFTKASNLARQTMRRLLGNDE